MCGIFGIITKENSNYKEKFLNKTLKDLAILSEARGKDSSGICVRSNDLNEFRILKSNQPISKLLVTNKYKNEFQSLSSSKQFFSFGHSRLVTNGSQLKNENNQPVVKNNLIAIHNGIIVNVDEINAKYGFDKKFDIDTEVFLSLINHFHKSERLNAIQALRKSFDEIFGTISTSLFFEKFNQFILATNNGSLYYATNNKDLIIYGSERFILDEVLKKSQLYKKGFKTFHLQSNKGIFVNLSNFEMLHFKTDDSSEIQVEESIASYTTKVESIDLVGDRSTVLEIEDIKDKKDYHEKKELLEYNISQINELKRCSKCILPETFPFIEFDDDDICNYCNNYVPKNQPKSIEELKKLVEPYRSKDGSLDCLVPFSGGRDSTYVLHFVKNVLNLNPLAYTYDWGMVTDLARRNIARVCGKLGVENVIVAADIKMKRRNIKKNIEAWLKKPDLGMIPLFMAGDKQFFKYANVVKKQANIDLNIWGINFLENTDFKVGFCGVEPDWHKEMIYSMNAKRKYKLFKHVGLNFLTNPSYLNSSLWDTFDSFLSRYMNPRKDYYHFFDFYHWDEVEIEKILLDFYDWEVSKDLKSTWRIGDGTASFYNYIYYTVAGFSEFDTFRSNQIREGMITREEALELVNDENKPRYDSLRWYLEIVGVDFDKAIEKVNSFPKLY